MVRRVVTALIASAVLAVAVFWGGSAGSGTGSARATSPPRPVAVRVAYIYQDDLWVGDLNGNAPRRLTQGGDSARPAWSPSGQWLLVEKGATALLIDVATGASHRVSAESGALASQWAPDRDRLAFVDGQGRLQTVNADGSDLRQVAGPPIGAPAGTPIWSRDGKWLAFAAPVKGPGGGTGGSGTTTGAATPVGLWRVPAAGGKPELLYQRSDGERPAVIPAVWTADGNAVVAWSGPMVTPSIMADGLSLLVVPVPAPEAGQPAPRAGGPATTQPTPLDLGFALVHHDFVAASASGPVAAAMGAGRMTWTKKRVNVFPPGTSKAVFVSPDNMAATSVAWSPNGSLLAYVAMPDLGEAGGDAVRQGLMKRRTFIVTPAAGTGAARPQQLDGDPRFRDESPHWVSDQQIVFARVDERGEASIWVTGVDRPEPRLVAELGQLPVDGFGYYGWIDWSRLFDVWPVSR